MKSHLKPLFTYIILFNFIISCGSKEQKTENTTPTGRQLDFTNEVTFLNTEGDEISTIRAAVADEGPERNQGLMDVNDLPNDAGMIFIFPDEAERSFYMANTPLPLDIMFVNQDSVIIRIHHNTTPFNSEQLPSDGPAKFVVETNAGYAVSNDIQEGMKIRF
ncbi:DUF192 domain-containing protein [Gracilimonas sp.]|uniref:DUF192 domain-containing protein n=1 Tax=Gracilimonas sp. TaxID=1974203 RepID=UPI002871B31E|nr:DUF192 domain-containing protein [Gracilimonas sp.]